MESPLATQVVLYAHWREIKLVFELATKSDDLDALDVSGWFAPEYCVNQRSSRFFYVAGFSLRVHGRAAAVVPTQCHRRYQNKRLVQHFRIAN